MSVWYCKAKDCTGCQRLGPWCRYAVKENGRWFIPGIKRSKEEQDKLFKE